MMAGAARHLSPRAPRGPARAPQSLREAVAGVSSPCETFACRCSHLCASMDLACGAYRVFVGNGRMFDPATVFTFYGAGGIHRPVGVGPGPTPTAEHFAAVFRQVPRHDPRPEVPTPLILEVAR